MSAYLSKRMPEQDKFLRRFIQPGYCATAGSEMAAFEQNVAAVRVQQPLPLQRRKFVNRCRCATLQTRSARLTC